MSELRTALLVIEVFVASLLGSTFLAQSAEPPQRPDSEYQALREKRWDKVLDQGGSIVGGLVLEARPDLSKVQKDVPGLVLSVRNLGDTTVNVVNAGDAEPEVWVRNNRGLAAKLGKKGLERYGSPRSNYYVSGHSFGERLRPGFAAGYHFALGDYFLLDEPGRYTVLGSKLFELGGERLWLVAKPLSIELRRANGDLGRSTADANTAKPGIAAIPGEPTDRDWTDCAAHAGNHINGCILEALDSPLDPGKARLVVSLLCEAWVNDRLTYMPDVGATADDYSVLLRDAAGQVVPRLATASRVPRTESSNGLAQPPWRQPGNGIGTIIPLAERFFLNRPGQYWVIVALPSDEAGKPRWVAKPIKFWYKVVRPNQGK